MNEFDLNYEAQAIALAQDHDEMGKEGEAMSSAALATSVALTLLASMAVIG